MASQNNNAYTVEVLRGAQFVPLELNRDVVDTLDQFRSHMDISARAVVTVRGSGEASAVQRDGSYVLQAGDMIASVESDKTGGKETSAK